MATSISAGRLVLLTIARASPGARRQESSGPRTVSPSQVAVAGLPQREVLVDVAAGVVLVLLDHRRHERSVGLRADRRAQRVVERLAVDAKALDLLLSQPRAGLVVGAGRLDEVLSVVAV